MIDRIATALAGVGGAFNRVAAAMRSPNVAPEAHLPDVPQWGSIPKNTNDRLADQLRTFDAYRARVSYDAGPSWSRFSTNAATDLTPEKIIGAQQQAMAGYPLYMVEMTEQALSRDAHLSGIGQQRVDDVVKGSWRLTRGATDPMAACVRGFCHESLQGIDGFEDDLAWLLWSNAYSYTSGETIWVEDRIAFPGPKGERLGPIDCVTPRTIESVHSKHFRFDLRTDEPLLWLGSDQVSLPFGKFVFMPGEGQNPIIERRGYMWPCIWLSMAKSIGLAGWITFVERYGLPTPLVEYEGGLAQYTEYSAAWADILNRLGKGFGAIVPKDVANVRVLENPSGGRASDPHSALADACDAGQSIRVLGATLTAKIGNVGSFAASTSHMEVKYAREEADARRLWSCLRSQLLFPIVYFNAPAIARALCEAGYDATPAEVCRRVPRGMHRVPREVDPVQRATVVSMAMNDWGIEVGKEALYDEFNLPQPLGDDDVAPGRPQQITAGGKVIGSVEASTDGAEAPKEPPPGPAKPALPEPEHKE